MGAVYHDIDVSRSIPWSRRPEASRLLTDIANPNRGWTRLVIGEPQRAFSGGQFQLVFPVLSHYGVELWVPEVGGRIDPDSEAHDLVMGIFGGLSKAERRRIQHRTRAAMLALATDGRWLGGRVNYGYRLVDTGRPHPNKSKAAAGARLRTLQGDPDTAPIVERIFQMYDEGLGFRSIARALEREGVPSPGEVGPTRHPRSAGVWGGAAVRAILTNPRYLGRQVAGRFRRNDELLDARDPALGTASRQRRQHQDSWSWSEETAWPALVSEDLFKRVNGRITNNPTPHARRPRSAPGRYVLSGAIRCGHCGKAMYGTTAKNKPYYRCAATRPDYAKPAVADHPPTYMVREERIVAAVDRWLATLTEENHLDTTVAAVLAADAQSISEPPEVAAARRDRNRLHVELDRMLAAIRAGMDPSLAASQTRAIQADIAGADSKIRAWESTNTRPAALTETQVRTALIQASGLVALLAKADRPDRQDLYRALRLNVRYHKEAPTGLERIQARLELTSSGGRI